ncbi:glutamate ABC transporter substrate-binding protein [Actinospica durhamensis]|uniref:Glutamate ABC transporter substrate-binding protein n=1 Tax=Actinospica durhamensis TaxID=1508375 RepID=A0A941EVC7_9ACTN|nr:glutamate ABC transporter substrate-binding protein [Actinospica durhamensis]MBR7834619.1 glutamate ABC transporter substrate-binding protein [Actinospica durhamensis]
MVRRRSAWLCALALAAVTASACSAGTDMVGAQPPAPTVGFGSVAPSTSSTGGSGGASTAPTCDATASSLAPTAAAANGPDVTAIKNQGYIRVGVSADQYLTGYLNSAGHEEGFDIDLADALGQALFGTPKKVQFVALSTADRIPDLRASAATRKVDVVIDTMTINCARLLQVGFSAVYYTASQKLLVDKKPDGTPSYTSIAQLAGKKVCAQSGSTSIAAIQAAKATAMEVTNVTDCLVLLQENTVQAISTDDTLLAGLAKQDPNVTVVGVGLEPEPYGIAVPPNEKDLEEYINGVLAQYESDGGWAASYAKWFGPSLGPAQPPAAQYSD